MRKQEHAGASQAFLGGLRVAPENVELQSLFRRSIRGVGGNRFSSTFFFLFFATRVDDRGLVGPSSGLHWCQQLWSSVDSRYSRGTDEEALYGVASPTLGCRRSWKKNECLQDNEPTTIYPVRPRGETITTPNVRIAGSLWLCLLSEFRCVWGGGAEINDTLALYDSVSHFIRQYLQRRLVAVCATVTNPGHCRHK